MEIGQGILFGGGILIAAEPSVLPSASAVDYLIVAGGGGGGRGFEGGGGGGGAGGFRTATSMSVTAGTSYPITVGAGGPTGPGAAGGSNYIFYVGVNGNDSSFNSITSLGGGGGGGKSGDGNANCYRDWETNIKNIITDRKSTRLNSSHSAKSRMPSSA